MNLNELMILFSLFFATIFFIITTIMGKEEIGIKLKKKFGLMRGRIIAKEIGKDGKIYTFTPKIQNNKVKCKRRSYSYNIKHTVVNKFDMREAIFSEITGKQLNPYKLETQGTKLSADDISDMLIMATAMAMIPKPLFSMKNIPWLMLVIGIGIIVFILTGGIQP